MVCGTQELLEKCTPIGMFDAAPTLAVAQNMRDLYRLVLVDTPLAPYFSENLTSEVRILSSYQSLSSSFATDSRQSRATR